MNTNYRRKKVLISYIFIATVDNTLEIYTEKKHIRYKKKSLQEILDILFYLLLFTGLFFVTIYHKQDNNNIIHTQICKY